MPLDVLGRTRATMAHSKSTSCTDKSSGNLHSRDILLLKLNVHGKPIANKYCEGKMKRTLKTKLKDLKSLRSKELQQYSGCALTVQRGLEVFLSSLKAQAFRLLKPHNLLKKL